MKSNLESVKQEVRGLEDRELLRRTESLAGEERRIISELIEHLREVNRRKLFSDLGLPSLFVYCIRILRMSEGSAQRRINAMRLSESVPEVREKIVEGSLSLSVASQLQTFITRERVGQEKKQELVEALSGKSCSEAERELFKHSVEPERHIPERARPVSATHTQISFVASEEQMAVFEKAKGLLAAAHPEMNWSEFFTVLAERAVKALEPTEKSRRTIPPVAESRRPSVGQKREVWKRDKARCTKCGSSWNLQLDHRRPWAKGGLTTSGNLRLLCRNCNRREAIRSFGLRKITRSGLACPAASAQAEILPGPRSPAPR